MVRTLAYLHHIPGLIPHPRCLLGQGRGLPSLNDQSLNLLANRHLKGQVPALGTSNHHLLDLGYLDHDTTMDISWAYADASY